MVSRGLNRFVVKDQQLFCMQSQAGKSPTVVVSELDLKHIWSQRLHDGSDLSTPKLALR